MRRIDPRRGFAPFATALLLAGAVLLGGPGSAEEQAAKVRLRDPASTDSFELGAGSPVLHVAFFATWCQACVEELPELDALEARWSDRGYRLVLVAVRSRQTAERLSSFAGGRELPGRLGFDEAGELEKALAARELPTHVLLDARGNELFRAHRAAELGAAIEKALGGSSRRR